MNGLAIGLQYTLGGIYAVLAGATAISATVQQVRPHLNLGEVTLRIRSWWVMVIVFTTSLLIHPKLSVAFFALVGALALREFLRIEQTTGRTIGLIAYPALVAQYALVAMGRLDYMVLILLLTALAVPAVLAIQGRVESFAATTGTALLGILLTVFALGHAAYLLALPQAAASPAGAAGTLMYLVVLTQVNDVAQFLWGKALGRRQVAPTVSPNKTVAGFVGGIATTAALSGGLGLLLTNFTLIQGVALGAGIAAAGFVGDLTMSAIKRDAGVKDTGSLLPGHGGVLDRVDSLIFTAPLFFHFLRMFGG